MKTHFRSLVFCVSLGVSLSGGGMWVGAAESAPSRAIAEPVVTMRPFKVMAEWMEIQPVRKGGVIDYVRIAHVQPTSPAAVAGVQAGMQVVDFQGISVVGLTEAEFIRRMENLPPAGQLTLRVRSVSGQTPTVVAVPFTALPAAASPPPGQAPTAAAPLSEGEVTAQLAAARRAIEDDFVRVRAEARSSGKASTNMYVQTQISKDLGRALPAHLALLCEAAAKGGDTPEASMFRGAIVTAITARNDYAPEQKAIVLRHLPKAPELLNVVDRMGWYDGADAAIKEGWKKASDGIVDDVLNFRASKYAVLAARHGLADALVALARTTRASGRSEPSKRRVSPQGIPKMTAEEEATLKALIPQESGDAVAAANFVLKNKSRLQFDAAKGVYVLKPSSPR